MITDAKTIQAAREAGLKLTGQDEERLPQWMGEEGQFRRFYKILEHGMIYEQ